MNCRSSIGFSSFPTLVQKKNGSIIYCFNFLLFCLALQLNSCLGRLVLWLLDYTKLFTHPSRSDKHLAVAVTYTTHNKHKRRTSMHSVEFEPAISTFKGLQTYSLDRMTTGFSNLYLLLILFYFGLFYFGVSFSIAVCCTCPIIISSQRRMKTKIK